MIYTLKRATIQRRYWHKLYTVTSSRDFQYVRMADGRLRQVRRKPRYRVEMQMPF